MNFFCHVLYLFNFYSKITTFFWFTISCIIYFCSKNKIKSRLELFLFVTLISFYASGKIYYILLSLILIVYFLIKNQNKIKDTFLFGLINFFLIFLPIFLIKYKFLVIHLHLFLMIYLEVLDLFLLIIL